VRHSFGDAGAFPDLLAEGGLDDIHVETVSGTVRGIDGPTYARLNAIAIVGMTKRRPSRKTSSAAGHHRALP
jgi:hypothetical protein